VQRERAIQLVTDVLERLVAATAEHPLTLVDELYVFGSFARGALEPHDVDLAVEYTADDEYRGRQIWLMSRSRNPNTGLRAALAGRSRGLQFQFRELENLHAAGIATTVLWRRGDTLSAALDRLTAIQPDPNAGRAPRDEMHPAFEGIDRWVPRPARSLLTIWENAGAVSLHQVDLPDAPVRDAHAARVIDRNWVATSPLRRAANNASAYLAAHGVSLRAVHLHGHDIAEESTQHFIGLGWRYIDDIHHCLTVCDGVQWLEVPHPTLRRPLRGLTITVVDRATLTRLRERI
jgi:hypothetical protein